MNTLTASGVSHDFSTIDELTAIVRGMPGREGITQLWRDGLRFYWSSEANNSVDAREITQLEREGLVKGTGCAMWKLTEKGHVMAQHIMETPLPSPKWEMRR